MLGFSVTITHLVDGHGFTCSACEWWGFTTEAAQAVEVAMDHYNLIHPRSVMELSMS